MATLRKSVSLFVLTVWALVVSCRSSDDSIGPLPHQVWSADCVQLSPRQNGYRIDGICCTYILLPAIALNRNRRFSVDADYHTFNGAGFIKFPTVLTGQLSGDGQTLTISYSVNSVLTTHTLKPGRAPATCFCGCD